MKDEITDRFKRRLKEGDIVAFHSFFMVHACDVGTMVYDPDKAKGDRWYLRVGKNETYCGGDFWKSLQYVGERGRHLLGQTIQLEEFTPFQKKWLDDMANDVAKNFKSPFLDLIK